jgi:hypothetical protein
MVRTLIEIQGGRVSVRETDAGPTEVMVTVDGASSSLSPSERLCEVSECPRMFEARRDLLSQIADLEKLAWAVTQERDEARETVEVQRQRVADLEADLERYQTAHVCTSRCSINSHVAFEGSRIVKDLERELAESRQSTQARDRLLAKVTEEGERGRQMIIDLTRDLQEATERADENREWAERAELNCARLSAALVAAEKRLDQISGAVHTPAIRDAIRATWENQEEPRAMADAIRQVRKIWAGGTVLPETSGGATSQA